ncbi:MAG: hypothetical protein V4451_05840 [Pseudomonadota bacterium]
MSEADQVNQLRVTLLALLPKDGAPVKVAMLAAQASADEADVIYALHQPFMDGGVIFDVRADAYSARRAGTDLPTERKTT